MLISFQLSGVKNISSACSNFTEPLFVLSVIIDMMMIRISKIIGIILILFLAGCTKDDELKLPVKTQLILQFRPMDDPTLDFDYYPFLGIDEAKYVEYSGGMIGIQKIEFEGIREVGEDVFFEMDPEIDLSINEYPVNNNTPISEFELPQGVYKYIRVDFQLKSIDEAASKSDVGEDLLDAGFLIEGCYKHVKWDWEAWTEIFSDSIAIEVAIDPREKFVFRCLHDVEIKQPDYRIWLLFDLNNAFASLDINSFDEAEIYGDSLDRKIIISRNYNRELYEIFLYRLGLSTGTVAY